MKLPCNDAAASTVNVPAGNAAGAELLPAAAGADADDEPLLLLLEQPATATAASTAPATTKRRILTQIQSRLLGT